MTSYDKDLIASAASGKLFDGRTDITLGELPYLQAAFQRENFLIRKETPYERIKILAKMILDDVYKDESFAN